MISVIVPVYNVEDFLSMCINSILNQKYYNFELILVDDGSTDSSGTICDKFALVDDRITVVHKRNSGVSSARNIGIELASGRYVVFVDSDDYLHENYLMELIYIIQEYPLSWCFCGCNCVDEKNNILEYNCVYDNKQKYRNYSLTEYYNIWKANYSALLWIRIFDLDIIKKNNLKFDENMSLSEDVLFNLEYGKYCNGFSIINLPLYNHRVYKNDSYNHLDGKKVKNSFYINQKIYDARKTFIPLNHLHDFETSSFYSFIQNIREVANNTEYSLENKKEHIKMIVSCKEFKHSMKIADTSKENWKLLLALKFELVNLILKIF